MKAKDKVFVQFLALMSAFIGQFVSEGVMLSFPVLYPDLVDYFKATNAEISVVGSLTYGCWFLIGPISGRLVDKFGPVSVLMVSGAVGAVGCMLTMLSTRLWHVMITFGIIFGTSCGLAFIPAITVVGSYFKRHHHLATTAATVGGSVGGVVYPLVMQAILHTYPWQYCFAVTAYVMLQVIICGAIFYLKPVHENEKNGITAQNEEKFGAEMPETHDKGTDSSNVHVVHEHAHPVPQSHHDHHMALRVPSVEMDPFSAPLPTPRPHWRRNLIIFAVHNFFWNFGDFGFMTMLPLFLSHHHFTTDEIAFVISISMFATILGRLAAAAFSAWPRGDRILVYNLSTILSGICIWLFCTPIINLILYFSCAGVYGFTFGVQTALVPSVTIDLVGHDRTNMALGVTIFASGLAGMISPFASGLLTDLTGEYYLTFRIASLLVIGCFFSMIHLHWPLNRLRCTWGGCQRR